jgi:hypothetical protein
MKQTNNSTFRVSPKSEDSCWVALDFNHKIIAEDKDPVKVNNKAKKVTSNYIMSFIPKAGVTHIF